MQKKPGDIVAIIRAGTERGSSRDKELDIAIVKDVNSKRPSVGGSFPGVLPWETAKWFIEACVDRPKPDTISPARHVSLDAYEDPEVAQALDGATAEVSEDSLNLRQPGLGASDTW